MGKISCVFFLWMGPMNSEKGPISNSKISKTLKMQECFSYPNPRLVLRHWLRYQVMTNLFLLTRIVGKNTLSLIIPKTNFAEMGNEWKFSINRFGPYRSIVYQYCDALKSRATRVLPLSIFILGACDVFFCMSHWSEECESLFFYMIKVVICEWKFCDKLFGSS